MAQWLSYPTFSGPFSGQEQLLAASSTSPGAGMIRIPTSALMSGVIPVPGGPFLPLTGGTLTGPLYLAGDPTVPLQAATKQYVDGQIGQDAVINVQSLGATGDTVGLIDGTMTIGSNAFSSASAMFTVADIGKSILVTGAGAGNTPLQGTITGFTNAHDITLSFAAVTAVPWSDGIVVGGRTYYGTDDTAAVTAAISLAQTQGKTAYFPSGGYWLATQTSPISLLNVTLRGEGMGSAFWPYSGSGSVVLLSNTTTAAFNGFGATSVFDMGFYYPTIDSSQATPPVMPALFSMDTPSGGGANNRFERIRAIADTVFYVPTTGGIGRTMVVNCLIYGVRNIFWFLTGHADFVQPTGNYFGIGTTGNIGMSGTAHLQKFTASNGAAFRYDIGGGVYAFADGLHASGGGIHGYRYGILLVSGTMDVSSSTDVTYDGTFPLTVMSGAKIVSTAFTGGGIYAVNSPNPALVAHAFDFQSGAVIGCDITIVGTHITFAQGSIVYDAAGALTELTLSSNTLSNWGRTTTAGTYYAYFNGGGAVASVTITGNTILGNKQNTSNTLVGVSPSFTAVTAAVTVSGNTFNACDYNYQLAGSNYSIIIAGNSSINSAFASTDTSTAAVVFGANNWDIAPTLQSTGATQGFNIKPNEVDYQVGPTGSHVFNVGTTAMGAISSNGVILTSQLVVDAGNLFTAQNLTAKFGLNTNASLSVDLVSAANGFRLFHWFSGGTAGSDQRWQMGVDNSTESGGNAGANFLLQAFDDTGASIGEPFTCTRATLATVFNGSVRMNSTVGFNGTAPIAKPTVTGVKLPSDTVMASLLTALAAYGLLTDSST